jgi:diguanylate cyclase (GGDEF)-like protein
LLLAVVAIGDYWTHTRDILEFSPFYLVPVSFFSWFRGRRSGIAVAIASMAVGFAIRQNGTARTRAYLDAAVWLLLYLASTWIIAQLRRLYEHERHESRIDPLTRISNRRALVEQTHRARSFADRYGLPVSMAYLDLDGFKQINDRLGHGTGDKILIATAAVIEKFLRPSDVLARIGGDEFAVLLPATGGEDAGRIIERVRVEFARLMREQPWPVTLSVGLVSFFPPLSSVSEMIRAADEAMYCAKTQGKNRLEQRELAS